MARSIPTRVSITIPLTAHVHVPWARSRVRKALDVAGAAVTAPHALDLLVTEYSTNAEKHGTDACIEATIDPDSGPDELTIAFRQSDPFSPPTIETAEVTSEGGRGYPLIRMALAELKAAVDIERDGRQIVVRVPLCGAPVVGSAEPAERKKRLMT